MSTAIADLSEIVKSEIITKGSPAALNYQEKLVPETPNGFLDDTVWEAFQAQLEAKRQADIAELDCLPGDGLKD